jgi:uncharacterized protein YcbX
LSLADPVRIARLFVYPVKSCGGIEVDQADLTEMGLAQDRRWMIVDPAGRFRTQRDTPRLAIIRSALEQGGLRLRAPGFNDCLVPALCGSVAGRRVRVWNDEVEAIDAGDAAAAWLSDVIGTPLRLVRYPDRTARHSDPRWALRDDAPVTFADGWALHVISDASLNDLSCQLSTPLPVARFRPNIVLTGLPAWSEDSVEAVRVRGAVLRFVKPCTRCATTVTDQDAGRRANPEILEWLGQHRWRADVSGACFGWNLVVDASGEGTLRVGDSMEVALRDGAPGWR